MFDELVSKEQKRFPFRLGSTMASGLAGFISGIIVASIIWYVPFKCLALLMQQ